MYRNLDETLLERNPISCFILTFVMLTITVSFLMSIVGVTHDTPDWRCEHVAIQENDMRMMETMEMHQPLHDFDRKRMAQACMVNEDGF